MPSIRTLQSFLAVVRHGSFAAAGKEIGLTPAAVGLQIRALEDELNTALFDRSGRAIVLKPPGAQGDAGVEDLVRATRRSPAERAPARADRDRDDGRAGVGADGRVRRRAVGV